MISPKHSRSLAWCHVISLFNQVYQRISWRDTLFEAQHLFSPTNNFSCLVMCFPLSCRMCDDPSDWREHPKGIIPRTRFLRQHRDAMEMVGTCWEWVTGQLDLPTRKQTRLQTMNDKQPDRHWPKQVLYIPIISPCLPPRLTHYVGIPSYHQMNISSWVLSPTKIIMNHNQIIIGYVAYIATYTHHNFHV